MVTRETQAGTITRETMIPIQRLLVAAGETINKGDVCNLNSSGYLIRSSGTDGSNTIPVRTASPYFVALETVTASATQTAGQVDCPVAVPGHYVTVKIGDNGRIFPGQYVTVVSDDDNPGSVVAATADTDNFAVVVGRFIAKEGGTINRGTSNNNPETLLDTEEFGSTRETLSLNDVVEIYLGAS